MPSDRTIVNALSFDIEDWFHMVEIEAVADPRTWPDLDSLVERYTEWIVQTVTEAKTRATFFMLGWIAERYPKLVKLKPSFGVFSGGGAGPELLDQTTSSCSISLDNCDSCLSHRLSSQVLRNSKRNPD